MSDVNALPAAVRPPGRVGAPTFADVVAEHLDAVYRYLVYLTGDRAAAAPPGSPPTSAPAA